MKKPFLFLFTTFLLVPIYAQTIAGFVYDSTSKEPLIGASVYFDNTTIGTSTDLDGSFDLILPKEIKAGIVISFLGYQTMYKKDFTAGKTLQIYLKPDTNILEEVVLNPDDNWSREFKLEEFRKHYLGTSKRGRRSTILNEDDLILVYSKKRKRMYARVKAPLQIYNEPLQYKIEAELKAFAIAYSSVSKNKNRLVVSNVSYKGFNRYIGLDSIDSPAIWQARRQAYLGSVLHFMRSLAAKRLGPEGYQLQYRGKFVPPESIFSVIKDPKTGASTVRMSDRVEILYKSTRWSAIETDVLEFRIDAQGNHSPVDKVRFGGDMGDQRMGDTLPMDFLIQKGLDSY